MWTVVKYAVLVHRHTAALVEMLLLAALWTAALLFCLGNAAGSVATELYDALTGVQQEKIQDTFDWVVPVA